MTTLESVEELKNAWEITFPEREMPSPQQWGIWLLRYELKVIREGLASLATRYATLKGEMTDEHMTRFASAVMGRLSEERGIAA